jgi:hypothetical protein
VLSGSILAAAKMMGRKNNASFIDIF